MRLVRHTYSFIILILALSLFLFADQSRPPENQFIVKVLVFSIEKYCEYVSPHLKGSVTCKFTPTCSTYSTMVLKKYGFLKGTKMTINRLAKCSFLSSAHGEDYP